MTRGLKAWLVLPASLLLGLTVLPCFSLTRIAGVHAGEWYKYGDVNVSWNFNQSVPIPDFFTEYNETQGSLLTITNVSGATVFYEGMLEFKNGTGNPSNVTLNLENGGGAFGFNYAIIAAGLNENDTVYEESWEKIWINETGLRLYAGVLRTTNHVHMEFPVNFGQITYNGTYDLYWDQATGVLVEYSVEINSAADDTPGSGRIAYRLIENSVWAIPELPSSLILPLFITVSLLTVIFCKNVRKGLVRI